LKRDVRRMLSNARKFNASESDLYQDALQLEVRPACDAVRRCALCAPLRPACRWVWACSSPPPTHPPMSPLPPSASAESGEG
jgi:hypothetical protein